MKSVILLSGGLDSTVLLADRVNRGDDCLAVTFDYGQTHDRELESATDIVKHYGVDHQLVGIDGAVFTGSALTGDMPIPDGHADTPDATLVPGRNLVFLSTAAAFAASVHAAAVLFGANADDFAGYPDCRHNFIRALDDAVLLGAGVTIAAPYQKMTKPQIVKLGRELDAPLHLTWSCYRSGAQPCGRCGACVSRNEAMT